MLVGRLCKRAWHRAPRPSTTGGGANQKNSIFPPHHFGSAALQEDGVLVVPPTSASTLIADTGWADSADRWKQLAFGNNSPSSSEEKQQHRRWSQARHYSLRPNKIIECEVCPKSSRRTTIFEPLKPQHIASQGVVHRHRYDYYFSSRSVWGSVPSINYCCHTAEGAAAAGLESSSLSSAVDLIGFTGADMIINPKPRHCYKRFSSRSLWGSVPRRNYCCHTAEGGAATGLESSSLSSAVDYKSSTGVDIIINPNPSSSEDVVTIAVVDVEAGAGKCEETVIEDSKEVIVAHLHSSTITTETTLGPFQSLGLPRIENPTTKVVNRVCSILDVGEWGPGTLKDLEEADDLVITPFLTQQIVQRMSSKNVDVTWNFFQWAREKLGGKISMRAHIAMLDALGCSKEFETMKQAFALVLEDGHKRSAWPYNNALKWCSAAENVEAALYFWGNMKENNCKATVVTYTRLIDLLARQGLHQESLEIFRQMLQANCPPNISTYNVLIHAFGVAGQPEVAESLFDRLSELGCKANYSTYNTLISLHVGAGNSERALKYFYMMKADGMDIGDDVHRTLHISSPRVDKDVPAEMASQDTTGSFGTGTEEDQPTTFESHPGFLASFPGRIISPRCLIRLLEIGQPVSVEAKLEKIKPLLHPRFVVQVLQRLKNPETAMIFFDWAKDQPDFKHNEFSYSMMINILGRSRNNEALDRIMADMQKQGIIMSTPIFTALVTCYGRANDMEGALKVFQQMKESGCKPDIITYTSLIHLLAKRGRHGQAADMFDEMTKAGISPNMHTYSVMIYNLVKAGKVPEAVSLLKAMPGMGFQPSPITFATLIDHCSKEGLLDIAKSLFSQMQEQGVKPLRTTIKVLEAALRKAGMTEDADKIEKSRSNRFWDENFKSSTEKMAKELLLKDLPTGESSKHAVSVQ
ncbi:unnamed protein product [Calypogeia fissa]